DLVGSVADHDDHMVANSEIILNLRMIGQQFEVIVAEEHYRDEFHLISVCGVDPYPAAQDEGSIIDLFDRLIAATCSHRLRSVFVRAGRSACRRSRRYSGWRGSSGIRTRVAI